jgi:hypothetical protein
MAIKPCSPEDPYEKGKRWSCKFEPPEQDDVRAPSSRLSPIDRQLPPGLPETLTSGRRGGKASMVIFSRYERDLREPLDKTEMRNDQSSGNTL